MADQSTQLDYKRLTFDTINHARTDFIIGSFIVTFLLVNLFRVLPYKKLLAIRLPQQKPAMVTPSKPVYNTYTIKEGDGLWKIAEEKYGTGLMAEEIMKANNMTDPNKIAVGQVIKLPTPNPTIVAQGLLTPTSSPAPTPTPTPTPQGQISAIQTGQVTITSKTYVVQEGDGIWDIAVRAYGDGMMWQKIAEANNLKDPYNLEIGKTLVIPR